jgi:glycosyltransferase involved in cell wall biosynthesis
MIKHILLIHNYYQSHAPSGEDIAFHEDERLLRSKGHKITLFTRHNDEINQFSSLSKLAFTYKVSWSRQSYTEIEQLIKRNKPDIAHIHNTFPLISPSIYYALHKYGIPIVQVIHNYRLFCASGIFYRKNKICEECLEHGDIRAIIHGCYRNSRIQTLPIVFMHQVHRWLKTWTKQVDMYIALTDFSRQKLILGGLPEERIAIKPNFFSSIPEPSHKHENYAVFLGRLTAEKGVRTLIKAWENLKDIPIKIIGDGVLKNEVIFAAKNNPSIEFLGHIPNEQCLELLKHSMFMVMPSEWFEGFPMTIREALAYGKPVIASRMGAMAELINDGRTGLLFETGNSEDLISKVRWLVDHKDTAITMGKSARLEFESKYTAEKNYDILMEIYKKTTDIHKQKEKS